MTTTPQPPWNPDNDRRVHYSWIGGQPLGKLPGYIDGVWSPMVLVAGISLTRTTLVVTACATAIGSVMMLRRSVVMPWFVPLAMNAAISALALWWVVKAGAGTWLGSDGPGDGTDRVMDDAFRVRCIGGKSRLVRLGKIEDVAFEPEEFDASLAEGGAPGGRVARGACTVTGTAVVAVGAWLATGTWPGFGSSVGLLYVTLLLGVMLGALVASVVWPVYYRVVPGRIERITTGFLARGPEKTQSWSLRHCGVTVDLYKRAVLIDPPGSARVVLQASLLGRAYEFERAVLMGAVSSVESPPTDDAIDSG